MADLPCPVCELRGGFHDSSRHTFGIERATELWGPPQTPPPNKHDLMTGYTPYVFLRETDKGGIQTNVYVIRRKYRVRRKGVIDEVSGSTTATEGALQGDQALPPEERQDVAPQRAG